MKTELLHEEAVELASEHNTTAEKIQAAHALEIAGPEAMVKELRDHRAAIERCQAQLADQERRAGQALECQAEWQAALGEYQSFCGEVERAEQWLAWSREFIPSELARIDGAIYAVSQPHQLVQFAQQLVAVERLQAYMNKRLETLRAALAGKKSETQALAEKYGVKFD